VNSFSDRGLGAVGCAWRLVQQWRLSIKSAHGQAVARPAVSRQFARICDGQFQAGCRRPALAH
jgi:hypothetical protein